MSWFGRINKRSSRREVFCKKDVLRNCAKFTGKHLCQGFFFPKSYAMKGASPTELIEKSPERTVSVFLNGKKAIKKRLRSEAANESKRRRTVSIIVTDSC